MWRRLAGRMHDLLHPHSLRTAIRSNLRELGLPEPDGIAIDGATLKIPGMDRYEHRGLVWESGATRNVHPEVMRIAELAVRDRMLLKTRDRLRKMIGPTGGRPPSWINVIHPLALRLALMVQPDRTRQINDDWGTMFDRVRDVNVAMIMNGRIDVQRFSVTTLSGTDMSFICMDDGDRVRRCQLLIGKLVVPDTITMTLAGRRLTDVVDLPPTGHEDVDQAIAGLTIHSFSSNAFGSVVTFDAAPLVTYGVPWDGYHDWQKPAGIAV